MDNKDFRGILLPQLYKHLLETLKFDKENWFHGKVKYDLTLTDERGFKHKVSGYVPDN